MQFVCNQPKCEHLGFLYLRGLVGDVALGTAEVGYRMNSVTDGIEIRTNDNIKAFITTNDLAGVHINAQIAGYDVIYGGRAHDDLSAGASNTNSVILLGGEGNDIITGGLGDDYLIGDAGADIINGGAGHDVIFMDKSDKINGGEMYDVAIVASADGVVLNMGATNIEAFIGNIGNDTINASTMVKGDTEYTAIIQSSEGKGKPLTQLFTHFLYANDNQIVSQKICA